QVAHERVGIAGSDVEGLDVALRELVLALLRDRPEPAAIGLQRQHDVVAHGEVAHDALVAAVLGGERDAVADGLSRGAQARALAADPGLAGVGAVDAPEEPGELRAARAEEAGEPDDLASGGWEVGGVGGGPAAEAVGADEQRGLRLVDDRRTGALLEVVERRELLAD